MLTISVDPLPGGRFVQVPAGQSQVLSIGGTYVSDDDPQVAITVTAAGQLVAGTPGPAPGRWQAAITVTCPSRVRVQASIQARMAVAHAGGVHWVLATRSTGVLDLVVRDAGFDPLYVVNCRAVDSQGEPLPGLEIQAYDQDPKSPHDPLGTPGVTDADGQVELAFHQSDFTETAGERGPDLMFRIRRGTSAFTYGLPGERTARGGVLPNFQLRAEPVTIRVDGLQGFRVAGAIRTRWLSHGAHAGFLGLPTSPERSAGRGRRQEFEGGTIASTPEYGAHTVVGQIRRRWVALGAESSWLGLPVAQEQGVPGTSGARAGIFEHGTITWAPGQAAAVEAPHDFARIHGQLRAQILSRFFAIGHKGRRNFPVGLNLLQAAVPPDDGTVAGREEDDRARWRIARSVGENPFLHGSLLTIALAVEHLEGHAESSRILRSWLDTVSGLLSWNSDRPGALARLPQRWDAGLPTDHRDESEQFLPDGNGGWAGSLPAANPNHYARRDPTTLTSLLGPRGAERYAAEHDAYGRRFRMWELSMDELVGLVTSCWVAGTLAGGDPTIGPRVRELSAFVGNFLADNGYLLVRPMGGLSWQGSTGVLPALEHPMSRALGNAAGTTPFAARTDFAGAMRRAGYWAMLEGPVTGWQALSWTFTIATLAASPVALALGLNLGALQGVLAGQVISPGTLGGATALYLHRDVFDVKQVEEVAMALVLRDAPNKPALYRSLATAQAAAAPFKAWSVNFHAWLGLTGVDDPDPTVRDAFRSWFALRQNNPANEPKGMGSRTLMSAAVATLIDPGAATESRLVSLLDQAVVELCRDRYFDPRPPVGVQDGDGPAEYAQLPWYKYESEPQTPYSPLDFLAACALAFWHSRRRADAGTPIVTPRFPGPLTDTAMTFWPRPAVPAHAVSALTDAGIPHDAIQGSSPPTVSVPEGYPLFEAPVVARRPPPTRPVASTTTLLCDVTIPVPATAPGEVATGVTLHPGMDLQIEATGTIWAGNVLDPSHGPDGLARPVLDARWPLHAGIDPRANAFCLLGRLNGWFRVGATLPRFRWTYPEARSLHLRINDDAPGNGNGQYLARIRVFGPAGVDPALVFRPPSVLTDGGVLYTTDARDLIEVTVTPGGADPTMVVFELATPPAVTWRKELVIREGPQAGVGAWTVATQDHVHLAENALYGYQLPGATLAFGKQVPLAISQVRLLGGLERIPLGTRIRFEWVRD